MLLLGRGTLDKGWCQAGQGEVPGATEGYRSGQTVQKQITRCHVKRKHHNQWVVICQGTRDGLLCRTDRTAIRKPATRWVQLTRQVPLQDNNWGVCQGHIIKYKVTVNDVPVNALYDTGTSMSCMAKRSIDTLLMKPKLIPCNRFIAGMGGDTLILVGECFIQLQIGKRVFRDQVVVTDNLRQEYILGQVLHMSYQFSTWLVNHRQAFHYDQWAGNSTVDHTTPGPSNNKINRRITLPPVSVSIIEVTTPKLADTTNLYKMNVATFQLPEGIILLDVLHRVDHKTPQYLNISVLNTNNVSWSIDKNTPIASMHPVGRVRGSLGGKLEHSVVQHPLTLTTNTA